jgi:maltose/moltooligosaccharide transporter
VVGFMLPALVLAKVAQRIGRVRTQVICVAIMAAGYFLIATVARTPVALYVLMGVVGIGWGAVVSLPFAIMSEKVDKSRMGYFMGLFNLSVVLPQLLSTVIGYVLRDAADKNVLFLICGGCLATSAVLWMLVKDNKQAESTPAVAVATH